MEGFARVGRAREFQERRPHTVSLEGVDVVVVKIADMVYAFENNCPHQHFSLLHQGVVNDCSITCPMHGWTFDLNTGKSTSGNGILRQREVRLVDDWVWIQSETEDQAFPLFDGI